MLPLGLPFQNPHWVLRPLLNRLFSASKAGLEKVPLALMPLGAILVSGLSLAAAGPAHAGETYYVSTDGSDDSPGTAQFPWRTVQKACETLEAGDTAYVLEGLYNEKVYVEVQGDSRRGPVTIEAKGKAVISGQGKKGENIFYIEDKSHLRIIGFEIRDLDTKDGSAIRFEGSGDNIEFRDNVIHRIYGKNAMGITVYGTSSKRPVSNLTITGNHIYDCEPSPSEALVLNGNVTNFVVSGNNVHDVNNIGIDFIGGEDSIVEDPAKVARNGVCRGNRVTRARSNYGGGFAAGIYVDGGSQIVIENNTITECDMGIEIGAENQGTITQGVIVRNNLIYQNDKAGIAIGGYDKSAGRVFDCGIFNNLCRNNASHKKAEGELWIQVALNNQIKNNILIGGGDKPLLSVVPLGQSNVLDYNLWFHENPRCEEPFVWLGKSYGSLDRYRAASGQDPHSLYGSPVHGMDRVHLSAGSPAIDAGDPGYQPGSGETDIDGQDRVSRGRVDIGPDEVP